MVGDSSVRKLCVSLLVLLIICGGAATLTAQVAGGTISGTVTDSSGRVINNVKVMITNVATGVTREVTTNDEGFYSAPNLLPGTYEAKFSAQGFRTQARSNLELTVGASVALDQVLPVGSNVETIVVQSEVPAVQLSTSDISAVVNATTVRELPLNGRSWTDLAQLQPGVNAIQTQPTFAAGTDRGNRGFGQQLTISGARPQQNNYRLDGVSLNDYANGAPGSVLGGNLGVDAIQEFSVLTSNYAADYGKTSGGVVNAITRSGTNQIHGSAYEFFRNSKLDAMNYFDVGKIPPFKRNQFGGTIGGPIVKDHTFFFADYEGIRASGTEHGCKWRGPQCQVLLHFLPFAQRGHYWKWRYRRIHLCRTADRQRKLLHHASGSQVFQQRQPVRYIHVRQNSVLISGRTQQR